MERARVNGLELAYEVTGTGVPVLLIGGTRMPAVGWQFSQSPALVAAGYQVVTFASRGVAPSEAPPSPYRVADLAADTAALIEYLAIGRASWWVCRWEASSPRSSAARARSWCVAAC